MLIFGQVSRCRVQYSRFWSCCRRIADKQAACGLHWMSRIWKTGATSWMLPRRCEEAVLHSRCHAAWKVYRKPGCQHAQTEPASAKCASARRDHNRLHRRQPGPIHSASWVSCECLPHALWRAKKQAWTMFHKVSFTWVFSVFSIFPWSEEHQNTCDQHMSFLCAVHDAREVSQGKPERSLRSRAIGSGPVQWDWVALWCLQVRWICMMFFFVSIISHCFMHVSIMQVPMSLLTQLTAKPSMSCNPHLEELDLSVWGSGGHACQCWFPKSALQ